LDEDLAKVQYEELKLKENRDKKIKGRKQRKQALIQNSRALIRDSTPIWSKPWPIPTASS